MQPHAKRNPDDDAHQDPVANRCVDIDVLVNGKVQGQRFYGVSARPEIIPSDQAVDGEGAIIVQHIL